MWILFSYNVFFILVLLLVADGIFLLTRIPDYSFSSPTRTLSTTWNWNGNSVLLMKRIWESSSPIQLQSFSVFARRRLEWSSHLPLPLMVDWIVMKEGDAKRKKGRRECEWDELLKDFFPFDFHSSVIHS